jgi:hypothetical protein
LHFWLPSTTKPHSNPRSLLALIGINLDYVCRRNLVFIFGRYQPFGSENVFSKLPACLANHLIKPTVSGAGTPATMME